MQIWMTWKRWMVTAWMLLVVWGTAIAPAAAEGIPEDVITRPGAGGAVTMHYPERFEKAADDLEDVAVTSLSRLRYQLGLETMRGIDVWLLSDLDDYFEWQGVKSRAPTWAIGLSLVDRKTVLVRHGLGPNRQLVDIHDTFEHELAHVAIDMARQGKHVPRWFNEGYASYHAGEWTLERGEEVARAAASGTLIPLKKLDRSFPSHQQSTSIAYAQSHHFVRMMAKRYGEDVFADILDHIRDGETFSVAFTMATGDDFENVAYNWQANLAEGSSPLSNLADGTILFFGATLVFLVAWAVRRRRMRAKYDHLDDDVDSDGWDYDPSQYELPRYS